MNHDSYEETANLNSLKLTIDDGAITLVDTYPRGSN